MGAGKVRYESRSHGLSGTVAPMTPGRDTSPCKRCAPTAEKKKIKGGGKEKDPAISLVSCCIGTGEFKTIKKKYHGRDTNVFGIQLDQHGSTP
jgi:hypothetical protein